MTASYPITTINHKAVRVGLQEIIIEHNLPLSTIDFSFTMRNQLVVRRFIFTNTVRCKGLESIGELHSNISEFLNSTASRSTHLLEIRYVLERLTRGF